jgi:fructokinase
MTGTGGPRAPMTLVAGESLIDLIAGPGGTVHASPGGGAFNTARTISRLGLPARFLGRFSADPFGRLLAGTLAGDGVGLAYPEPVAEPTTLAVVALSGTGTAQYWFHLAGTAAFLFDLEAVRREVREPIGALHAGSLGLVTEPMAAGLEALVCDLPTPVLLMIDPNWRPRGIPDSGAHRARIHRLLPRTDILKLSTEDLAFLVPGSTESGAVRELLRAGARCLVLTDGPAPVRAFTGDHRLAVPVPQVEVADTVGAGDAFGGGLLAWWAEHRLAREHLSDPGLLRAALTAAGRVAAATCRRVGADPPWRRDVRGFSG